ncbi:MAG: hypothetical protein LBQ63_07885 [Deltaproteobacteria bacterium]|jgi:hypothetical protein|nr:hypothetical protein [Deltaproteobacteria bacterium]
MKTLILAVLLTICAAPALVGSCGDTQNAANAAMKERNAQVKDSHNVMMPDPEEDRGPLSDCLGSIGSIGDIFSLGVSFPSMDQIVAGMCKQVDSLIQNKMDEVLSEVKSSIPDIGGNNPFQVSGSGKDLAISLTGKLK